MPYEAIDILSPLGVSIEQLEVGRAYFMVSYLDHEHRLPTVETFTYIGTNRGGESDGTLYFQDTPSYIAHGAYDSVGNREPSVAGWVLRTGCEPPKNLFGFDGLLDELSRCAARDSRARQAGS